MGCNCNNNKQTYSGSQGSNNRNSSTPADQTTYAAKSFLPPYNGENYLQLRDKKGIIRHKIYNNTLTVRYTRDNLLHLKIASENKVIVLDFATADEAHQALILLSDTYNLVRQNS